MLAALQKRRTPARNPPACFYLSMLTDGGKNSNLQKERRIHHQNRVRRSIMNDKGGGAAAAAVPFLLQPQQSPDEV